MGDTAASRQAGLSVDKHDKAQAIELREYEMTQQRAIQDNRQDLALSHCAACGEEISPARQAIRGVTRCLECQQDHELIIKRGLRS